MPVFGVRLLRGVFEFGGNGAALADGQLMGNHEEKVRMTV